MSNKQKLSDLYYGRPCTSHKIELEGLLRKAANALFLNDEFTEAQKHNYFMSVTEREVYKGCINAKNVKVSQINPLPNYLTLIRILFKPRVWTDLFST